MTAINTSSAQYTGLLVWLPSRDGTGTTWHEFLSNTDITIDGSHNTWVADGTFGTALRFDHVAAARIDTGIDLAATSFSYAVWVRVHAMYNIPIESGVNSYIFSEAGTDGRNLGVGWDTDPGEWFVYNGRMLTQTSPTLDTWYHVVYSYSSSGSLGHIYINGSEDSVVAGTDNFVAGAAGRLYVGGFPGYDPGVFDGDIADLRVYDHVLSSSDVAAMYDPATRFDLYLSATNIVPVLMNQYRARRA